MGDSKVIIDVCTGIKNGGNEGGDPEDPKFPIIMDDNRNYAYLFEDQWPLYGDYDMNDLVLIIKERKISINKSNKAEEFTLSLDLSAAGATKSIGAAIMLDGVPASAITQPVEFSDNSLFKGFNVRTMRLFHYLTMLTKHWEETVTNRSIRLQVTLPIRVLKISVSL